MSQKIVFVYNANSGPLNALLDSAHKLLSPSTYTCSLCDLTSHQFGEKSKWKNYRKHSNFKMEFLHKDEFNVSYPDTKFRLPIVFAKKDEGLEVLMSHEELNATKNLENLIDQLNQKLHTNSHT